MNNNQNNNFNSPNNSNMQTNNNQNNTFSSIFSNVNNSQQANNPFSSIVDEIADTNGNDTFNSINSTNSNLLNNSINILPINNMNNEPVEPIIEEKKTKSKKNKKVKETNQNIKTKETNQNINVTDFHRRNLLMTFIGFKYEKISSNLFNPFALIFAEFYLLYRRMVLLGLILFATRIALIVYISPYISLLINIILFLTFNKLYIFFANSKVSMAEKLNKNCSYEQLTEIVASKGQVKMSNPITVIFLSIIIGIVAIVIASINGTSTGIFKDFNVLKILGKNPQFKGDLAIDENANINANYEIIVPNEISTSTSSEHGILAGIKTDPNDNFSNCHYRFNVLKDYSDPKNLAEQMTNYYNIKKKPELLQINSIAWYHITYENNGTVNLYLTSRNKKVYMYEFREEKNANKESCQAYNDSILNSIYYK